MATKRRKSRRSCKNGKLKRPVRTKNGGKRRCRKTKRSRKRRSKTYKVRSRQSARDKRRIYRGRRAVPVGGVNTVAPQMSKAQRKRLQKARRAYRRYLRRPDVRARIARTTTGFGRAFNVTPEEMRLRREAYPDPAPASRTFLSQRRDM